MEGYRHIVQYASPRCMALQVTEKMSQKTAVIVAGMTVYVYHGKGRGVKPQQLARYTCVLTTYTSMGMEAGPRSDAKHGTNPGQPIELEDSGNDDDAAVPRNADLVTLLATRL